MLEDIIKKNIDLNKHPSISLILAKVESIIPLNLRDNFYRNLSTLKIKFSNNEDKVKGIGYYEFKENTMYINLNFERFFLGKWSSKEKEKAQKEMLEGTLCHEFLHVASTKYYSQNDIINTGFSEIFDTKVLNYYLNEGFTEMLTSMIYPESFIYSGYKDTTFVARIITGIVGLEQIKYIYFSNSLGSSLKNYMAEFADLKNVEEIFYWISNMNWCKLKNNMDDYNYSLNNLIFNGLLPVLDAALKNGIANNVFNNIDDLKAYYETYILPYFNNLIDILLKNGYHQNYLIESLEEANFDIDNYANYFWNQKESYHKLGYISVYVLVCILLIFIGIGISILIINCCVLDMR